METETRMLNNFLKKYGRDGLKKISMLFLTGRSNQEIAEEFGVSRQRVHQWQKAFTDKKVVIKDHVLPYLPSKDLVDHF